MHKISILGSTGSIGTSTLNVARHLNLPVVALAARSSVDLIEQQAREFNPELVALFDPTAAAELQKRLPHLEVAAGMEGLIAAATLSSATFVVAAIAGTLGIRPTVAAIDAKKDVGLANKEVLVSAGEVVMQKVASHNTRLLPIDSEHSALFQCLTGEKKESVRRLILTASGGPFRDYPQSQLQKITVDQALNHPTWAMGPKVTVDSSTLMNKGLEVMEARWLFDLPVEQIEVVVHKESLIHSMVEFQDSSIICQMSQPSMELPIQYALTYPDRLPGTLPPFDFARNSVLHFEAPDQERFPCLGLAFEALKLGATYPCFLNGANEVLVEKFLEGQLPWIEISRRLEALLDRHHPIPDPSLEEILATDEDARLQAATLT